MRRKRLPLDAREASGVSIPGPGPSAASSSTSPSPLWRPRGQPLPGVDLDAEGARARGHPPRAQTVTLETIAPRTWRRRRVHAGVAGGTSRAAPTRGAWACGLHEVRLDAVGVEPGLPPLRAGAVGAGRGGGGGTALRLGAPIAAARAAGFALAVLLGFTHLFARAYAVLLLRWPRSPPALPLAVAPCCHPPRPPALDVAWRAARRLARAVGALTPWPAALIAAVALAPRGSRTPPLPYWTSTWAAAAKTYARGLLAYDAEGPVSLRHAERRGARPARPRRRRRGASRWSGPPIQAPRCPPARERAALGPAWTRRPCRRPHAGAGGPAAPRLRRRGRGAEAGSRPHRARRSLPAPRVALALGAAGVLLALSFAAAGVRRSAAAAGLALVLAGALALFRDPLLARCWPCAGPPFVAAGALLAAVSAALNERTGVSLPAGVVAACVAGFVAWLAAPLTPLYRGGHFVFHSSIAEEIWQGRLLHYALPYPGSMLSQQVQWGNIVVPHPCLFHVVAAPLAALPRPLFYTAVKAALALWLASMAAAALVARRLSARGHYAAVAVPRPPPSSSSGWATQ
jgi:hypothetical protein